MKNMKRFSVLIVCILLASLLCVSLASCNPNKSHYDPETRPFVMSISQPDQVFNPFFSTSAYDSTVISMTQISMLSTDENGKIVYGENEPTVALNYNEIEEKDANGKTLFTTYEFVIKNGIKWSDGKDLTIKDVLFNLYVYLDPAYTGSSTIYSTDIVGLQNYRQQTTEDLSDEAVGSFDEQFYAAANERITDDVDFLKNYGIYNASVIPSLKYSESDPEWQAWKDKIVLDFARYAREFYKELVSDWNNVDLTSYKDWHDFNQTWHIFLLNDGGYTNLLKREYEGGPFLKDDNANLYLDEEEAAKIFEEEIEPSIDDYIAKYNSDPNRSGWSDELKRENAIKEICIDNVFDTYFSNFSYEIRDKAVDKLVLNATDYASVYESLTSTSATQFELVATGWGTANTMSEIFVAEAKSDYFTSHDKVVQNVEGIRYKTVTSFKGKEDETEVDLGGSFDVLTIKIKGVDPKAIYNFAFGVAPMHYYSTTSWNGKNYIKAMADDFDANKADGGANQTEFGLEFGSSLFMTEVVNATSKIGIPVGAGVYMASKMEGGVARNAQDFFNNNWIYYERNPYFETVGKGLCNAKIKYVRYKVVDSSQIIIALKSGSIDIGDPNATQENLADVEAAKLKYDKVLTAGYGYVGINPRFVPSIEVRRAIMKAMDVSRIINNYYKNNFGYQIYRPISQTSWAYPSSSRVYVSQDSDHTSYSYDASGQEILELVTSAGYTLNGNGVLSKNIPGFGEDVLDYKFTIAGGSTDHPAYDMFLQAAQILNRVGFNVRVVTSQTALTDLSSGKLEVWAAAWSSGLDPDMYQIYHMDSQASATKNWGYAQILGNTNQLAWGDEYDIVVELSKKIDEGRATTDQDRRTEIYSEALDLIMELAVEFPTYQRHDMTVYRDILDESTLPLGKTTSWSGLLARMWEVNYK